MGYSEEQKGYRCYNPTTKKIIVSRDVFFNEMGSWYKPENVAENDEDHEENHVDSYEKNAENRNVENGQQRLITITCSGLSNSSCNSSCNNSRQNVWSGQKTHQSNKNANEKDKNKMPEYEMQDQDESSDVSMDEELEMEVVKTPGVRKAIEAMVEKLRRSKRERKPVQHYGYDGYVAQHYAYMVNVKKDVEPTCFEEAKTEKKWRDAMEDEMQALTENETWDLVKLPKGKKVIGCKWVYKVKHNANGSVSRYKARLVPKGYAQMQGVDYEETFAPVEKMTTIRTLLAVSAAQKRKLHHMDVKNAFSHGNLDEEVYMQQPPGFQNKRFPNYICKLKKALYGLIQAPRAWHSKIAEYLIEIGFIASKADPSLYVKSKNGNIVFVLIYVDDLLIGGDSNTKIEKVKKSLELKFHMKDLGELRYFLGIEIIRPENCIFICQRQYAVNMLKKIWYVWL